MKPVHIGQGLIPAPVANPDRSLVIPGQERSRFSQTAGGHVEDAPLKIEGDILFEPGHLQPGLPDDKA